jgi:hypothetical protein
MDRKKYRRIVKRYTDCCLYRLQKYLKRKSQEKKGMGKKVVGQEKYTWWISITFKRTVCRRSG